MRDFDKPALSLSSYSSPPPAPLLLCLLSFIFQCPSPFLFHSLYHVMYNFIPPPGRRTRIAHVAERHNGVVYLCSFAEARYIWGTANRKEREKKKRRRRSKNKMARESGLSVRRGRVREIEPFAGLQSEITAGIEVPSVPMTRWFAHRRGSRTTRRRFVRLTFAMRNTSRGRE